MMKTDHVNTMTSSELLSILIKDVFGKFNEEWNNISSVSQSGSIGRTYFSDRSKREIAIDETTTKKIGILFQAVLNDKNEKTLFDPLLLTESLVSIMKTSFGCSLDFLQFYHDDTDDLRNQKINGWLIIINRIAGSGIGKKTVTVVDIKRQISQDISSLQNVITRYSKGTFTEEVFKRAQDGPFEKAFSENDETLEDIPEYTTAEEYYEEAIKYEQGSDGIVANKYMALKLYERAAKLGHSDASYKYARLLLHKKDEKSIKEAFYYMEESANAGNSTAMFFLGKMFYSAHGERNITKAKLWFEEASKAGSKSAEKWIKVCILFDGIKRIDFKTPDVSNTIKFVNSIEDLIDAVSAITISDICFEDVDDFLLDSLTDDIFQFCKGKVESNLEKGNNDEVVHWRCIQAALLFFILVGKKLSYDVLTVISDANEADFEELFSQSEEQKNESSSNMRRLAISDSYRNRSLEQSSETVVDEESSNRKFRFNFKKFFELMFTPVEDDYYYDEDPFYIEEGEDPDDYEYNELYNEYLFNFDAHNRRVFKQSRIVKIAFHQCRLAPESVDFWSAVMDVAVVLLKINAENIGDSSRFLVRPKDKVCESVGVHIGSLSAFLDTDKNLFIRGTIEINDSFESKGEIIIKAILYNKFGEILLTLEAPCDTQLGLNTFSTFEISHELISRKIEVKKLHTIIVYPAWIN